MRMFRLLLCLIACAPAVQAQPELLDMPKMPEQGWASFDVRGIQSAADWCCFDTQGEQLACDLDRPDQGFASTSSSQSRSSSTLIRIFVRTESGRVRSIRPVGLSCKVTSKQPVLNFGQVAANTSLAWLENKVLERTLMDATLAAISAHDSTQADTILRGLTAKHLAKAVRKQALFWAGQMRGAAGFELALTGLQDASAKYRAHAVFVLAQSEDERRTAQIANTAQHDSSPHVRGQAWFWLAKTAGELDLGAAKLIRQAVLSDPDDGVQEQAIFALSQLSDGQASQALIDLIQDRSAKKSTRERALFWLAQSKEIAARDYLDRMLGASN